MSLLLSSIMLVSTLFLVVSAIATPVSRADGGHIRVKDADLCLSSAGRFERGAPLVLAQCADGEKDQLFTWEAFTEDGSHYWRIHSVGSEGRLCVAFKIPCTSSHPAMC